MSSVRASLACALALLVVGCSQQSQDSETAASPPPVQPSAPDASPNVLWILLDALRADHLSAYGYERQTSPFIDSLADRGTLFEQHFAQGPNTLMSVGSYMTGRYFPAGYQDERHLGIWFLKVPLPEEQLVSAIFKENGYATAMFSASPWYSDQSRLAKSFDTFEYLARERAMTPTSVDFAADNPRLFEWIETHKEVPFFLYVHSLDTHEPRFAYNTRTTWLDPAFPAERAEQLRWWKGAPFDEADQRYIADLYDGGIAYADETVAKLVGALETAGILDNTIVVISSDHGEVLGEDGMTLGHPPHGNTDDQLRTPLILAGPNIPPNRRVGVKTENADIVPTLIELLELKTASRFDGMSLRAAMQSESPDELREYAFTKTGAVSLLAKSNSVFTFDELRIDVTSYNAMELAKFGRAERPRLVAWSRPDSAASRAPVDVSAARTQYIEAQMSDRIEPLRSALEAQPEVVPPYYEMAPGLAYIEEGPYPIVSELDPTDNLWTSLSFGGLFDGISDSLLVCFPDQEDPPGLVMVAKARNGTYRVSASLRTIESPDGKPRGASFRWAQVDVDKEFRLFEIPAAAPNEVNQAWIDLGTYTVTENKLVYFLKTGNPEDVTVLGTLRFVREGAEDEVLSDEERAAEQERLNALGYGPQERDEEFPR